MSGTPHGPTQGMNWWFFLDQARRLAFPVVTLAVGAIFLFTIHKHYPLEHWLFFRYALAWTGVLAFCAACLSSGHLVVRRLGSAGMDLGSTLVCSFAAGVYLFFLSIFLLGIFGALQSPVFFLLPIALFAAGARPLLRHLVPAVAERLRRPEPRPWWASWVMAYGVLGVFLVYLPVLLPANLSYDSLWYHLPLAEHYAAAGAIRPRDGGWIAASLPHLASILYTWIMLAPKASLFLQSEMVLHLEFLFFLWTLAGCSVMLRLLLRGEPVRGGWVVLFLFPGLFVYDSGLHGGADHIAAFFAAPILIAFVQAWRRFDLRSVALLALFLSSSILVKYTAISIFIGPALAIVARALWLVATSDPGRRRRLLLSLAGFAAAGLLFTSPHWLKNFLFHGDPVYPLLHRYLRPHPWTPDSEHLLHLYTATAWLPGLTPPTSAREVLKIMATFALSPHDWQAFHGSMPVFGVLFSVASAGLLFLKGAGRLLGLAALSYAGVACWAIINQQDRYLQVLVPWMTAVTAGCLVLGWRAGWPHRVALVLVVGAQIVWGGDAPFLPAHAMMGQSPIRAATEFLAKGYQKKYDERLAVGGEFARIGASLPKGSKVLVHEEHIHFGIRAMTVVDHLPVSVGIDYGRQGSSAGVHGLLRGMGISHAVWKSNSLGFDSLASDLLFHGYITRHGEHIGTFGGHSLARLPANPPPASGPLDAIVLGCDGTYEPGVYPVSALHVLAPRAYSTPVFPAPARPWAGMNAEQKNLGLQEAAFLAVDPACKLLSSPVPGHFSRIATRGKYELWAR